MAQAVVLFRSVVTLFLYMLPAFILRKMKIADDKFALEMSRLVIYIAQIAMVFQAFLIDFDPQVLVTFIYVVLIALVLHAVFFAVTAVLFRNAPENHKVILRFGSIFCNCGFMGIPVINLSLGTGYSIYVFAYIVAFNVIAYSVGRYLYTKDKKYISIKEIILNPGFLPIIIGVILYVTGFGTWFQSQVNGAGLLGQGVTILNNVITVLTNMVAPASMLVIGARLADVKTKGLLNDRYMYLFMAARLIILPVISWVVLRVVFAAGLISADILLVLLIIASTPSASLTSMFSELYGGDSPYAGKLVAISTVLSIFTMPVMVMLTAI